MPGRWTRPGGCARSAGPSDRAASGPRPMRPAWAPPHTYCAGVRVGIVILPEHRWQRAAPRWRAAEEYGFAHAWTYDHLGWRTLVDGPWFDAVPTLTAAALVTERIRLGTFVASPNFRHPVSFARALLSLDDITDGRFVLGLGAGPIAGYDNVVLGGDELPPQVRGD